MKQIRMSVNVCTRYDESNGMCDPVSNMSVRLLVLSHTQCIVDWCCIWCEWKNICDVWSTDVWAVVKECEWIHEHNCDMSS